MEDGWRQRLKENFPHPAAEERLNGNFLHPVAQEQRAVFPEHAARLAAEAVHGVR